MPSEASSFRQEKKERERVKALLFGWHLLSSLVCEEMHLQFTTLLHNKNKSVGRDGLDGEK